MVHGLIKIAITIPREDPQREKDTMKFAGGEGKKRAKFRAVRRRAVWGREEGVGSGGRGGGGAGKGGFGGGGSSRGGTPQSPRGSRKSQRVPESRRAGEPGSLGRLLPLLTNAMDMYVPLSDLKRFPGSSMSRSRLAPPTHRREVVMIETFASSSKLADVSRELRCLIQ